MLKPVFTPRIGVEVTTKELVDLAIVNDEAEEMMGCAMLHPSYNLRIIMGKLLTILMASAAAFLFSFSHTVRADTPEPLKVGQRAPDFKLPDQNGKVHTLADFRGKWLALYFYVKDDTPGCTEQACKFRDDIHQLTDLGAQVIGVSVDDSA